MTQVHKERATQKDSRPEFPADGSSDAVTVYMHGITKRFPGVIANEDVDLELRAGEIHALLGENGAGKSTLMSVLCGLYRPDAGEIYIRGQRASLDSPRDAIKLGIGMVHQHFMLVEPLTVAENVILGLNEPRFILDLHQVEPKIREVAERYGMRVDPRAYIWQLSVGEQQRVEILKILYRGADVLILDEPTAMLTPQEADDLLDTLRMMTREGKTVVFITHKLDEVMEFSDRVTVLREGKVVATLNTHETNKSELARLMVGRDVLFRVEKEEVEPGDVLIELQHVSASNDRQLPALDCVSLQIRAGEILGIAGVAGNGQRELAEVITGLRKVEKGRILVRGQDVTNRSPRHVIDAGVSHVPEDRLGVGLVPGLSVSDNIALKGYRKAPLSRGPVLDYRAIAELARKLVDRFRIATPSLRTPVRLLSGGNLQKTILAREITVGQGVLVAVHPTRGLDVGATEAVQQTLLNQRKAGAAILLISEDLDELLAISDRIAVMYEGRIMGVVSAKDADIEALGLMMAGTPASEALPDGGAGQKQNGVPAESPAATASMN